MRFCCMKKILSFIILLMFVSVCTTACKPNTNKQNMIQSKRRFANYMEQQDSSDPNRIDISEGPKLKYEAKFGPKSPEFDIKIVDPY